MYIMKEAEDFTEAFTMIGEKSALAAAYTMEGQSWPGGGDQSFPVL